MPTDSDSPLLPHGGYESLRSYRVAEAVYDATVVFCDRFIDKKSRTHDQMVQAARSGVRNISEGSGAAATSKKMEMKLTNVARSSLNDELARDYQSFLLQRGLRVWPKNSKPCLAMRERLKHDLCPDFRPPPKARSCSPAWQGSRILSPGRIPNWPVMPCSAPCIRRRTCSGVRSTAWAASSRNEAVSPSVCTASGCKPAPGKRLSHAVPSAANPCAGAVPARPRGNSGAAPASPTAEAAARSRSEPTSLKRRVRPRLVKCGAGA